MHYLVVRISSRRKGAVSTASFFCREPFRVSHPFRRHSGRVSLITGTRNRLFYKELEPFFACVPLKNKITRHNRVRKVNGKNVLRSKRDLHKELALKSSAVKFSKI
jgi:hypothetical protein